MIRKSFAYVLKSIPASVLLIATGYLIAYVILGNRNYLDFVLFVLGAIPVVLFLPSVFSSSSSGALHTPKVIFRKVETLKQSSKQGNAERTEISFLSPLPLVLAGIITWIFSILLFVF